MPIQETPGFRYWWDIWGGRKGEKRDARSKLMRGTESLRKISA
jgi:hypothetical protein